ncbi:hypothetical protein V6238_17035 [Marinomonas arenicola]|uniref:hypothetical protein n=1 Tax=Marinomonas arenicola TaxID=569601 RepID=UPI00311DDB46
MELDKIRTEYYTVAINNSLKELIDRYKATDEVLYALDDRKLILYLVNLALDEGLGVSTGEITLSGVKDIKLKKTKKISLHFNCVNEKYKNHGVKVSSRQYFHRLLVKFLSVKLSIVPEV